jgi:glycosyltransferase involved in cell wall biosynthesis
MSEAMARRAHLCFVSSTIYPVLVDTDVAFAGGAEVQQAMIARALRARGHRVSVLTGDHGVPDQVTAEGIEVHHTPPAAGRGIKGLRRIHPRLTDVVNGLRRIDPDWVYFRCAGGMLAACAWYARWAQKRLVYAAAHDYDFLPGRIFGLERRELLLYRAGLRWCDFVVVQNREQQALLRQRFGREGLIVPNCYAESNVVAGDPAGPVLWVGTVKPLKRPELFLALAARFPQRRFVLVGGPAGDGDGAAAYYRRIETQARQLANVEFVGFVPFTRVGRHYDGAAALVNTSVAEGFPNTFLQAWIRSVPTLSFVAPTTSGEPTGTIACRDVEHMAGALGALLGDDARWGEASARASAHFQSTHSVEAVDSLYDTLLAAPKPSGRFGMVTTP